MGLCSGGGRGGGAGVGKGGHAFAMGALWVVGVV